MRWTRWTVLVGSGLALGGCYYGFQTVMVRNGYSPVSRPDPSYFCYDCHAYRFFDPYYDWCTYYGFRFAWTAHPRVVGIYRERYVRIKENHPEYGRYRYRRGYRASTRYTEARDYESWRQERPPDRGSDLRQGRGGRRGQEQTPGERGKKHRKKSERKGSRDPQWMSPGSKRGQR